MFVCLYTFVKAIKMNTWYNTETNYVDKANNLLSINS